MNIDKSCAYMFVVMATLVIGMMQLLCSCII